MAASRQTLLRFVDENRMPGRSGQLPTRVYPASGLDPSQPGRRFPVA